MRVLMLAIDTSTSAITTALHDGDRVLAHESVLDSRGHSEFLAPAIKRVLEAGGARPRDITDVVTGLGPGPFTGLRVGIVTGRTMALAVGARVHGVCSLDALAFGVADPLTSSVLVATDARRREVYWRAYERDAGSSWGWRAQGEPVVSRAVDIPASLRAWVTLGRGAELYPDALGVAFGAPGHQDVDARALAELTARRILAGEDLSAREPLYLRRPDAKPLAGVLT